VEQKAGNSNLVGNESFWWENTARYRTIVKLSLGNAAILSGSVGECQGHDVRGGGVIGWQGRRAAEG